MFTGTYSEYAAYKEFDVFSGAVSRNPTEESENKSGQGQEDYRRRKEISKAEKKLSRTEAKIAETEMLIRRVQEKLGNADLYTSEKKSELTRLQQELKTHESSMGGLLKEWEADQSALSNTSADTAQPINLADELFKIIGYRFENPELAVQAFTHLSYINEKNGEYAQSYEKLEFLGDAVLQMTISELLYSRFDETDEGKLTQSRSRLVSEESLARLAVKLGLGRFLRLGKGEEASGGREKPSILADITESLIGAIYLDSRNKHGIQVISGLILRLFSDMADKIYTMPVLQDSRSRLYELADKNGWKNLEFRCISETGQDHRKTYVYQVWINDKPYGQGTGSNKKRAARESAAQTLAMLGHAVA
ncbi:hypothetical protein CHS0354_026828 [Potamilus streckersoni]|uniref:ribonuclease III n=1 Tax=Potamilus streckersoni TaxID=2493646 RepID=A0AAE0T595_9BIVA|nr:hypothetical protein CHS0354_026828 [Potamilus streckersoni]